MQRSIVSETPTPTEIVAASPTPTTVPTAVCVGDCDGNGRVTIDELLTLVNIALGDTGAGNCLNADVNMDMQITIDEILAAVHNALTECSAA